MVRLVHGPSSPSPLGFDLHNTQRKSNMFISSEQNKLAHRIRRAHPSMSWGQCFGLARDLIKEGIFIEDLEFSVFGQWTLETQQGIAGHFWALRCLYREVGEQGRSVAFERVANQIYAASDEGVELSFDYVLKSSYWGASVIRELIEYYKAAALTGDGYTDHTQRIMNLISRANSSDSRVRKPYWRTRREPEAARLYRDKDLWTVY
jgi:hypothetical protein